MTETSPDTSPDTYETADAAPTTLRTRLRDRRETASAHLFTDRDVPRLPGVVVRFKPLPADRVEHINRQADKSKNPARYVIGAASSLAHTCVGVYDVTENPDEAIAETADGRHLVSIDTDHPDLDAPVFDKRLGDLLGVKIDDAVSVVRALYLTDGDVVAEANAVTTWSGYTGAEQDADYAGN